MAYEAFIIFEGRKESLNSAIQNKANSPGDYMTFSRLLSNMNGPIPADLKAVDVVLKPYPQGFDPYEAVTEMWGKPVAIKNVPLDRMGANQQPKAATESAGQFRNLTKWTASIAALSAEQAADYFSQCLESGYEDFAKTLFEATPAKRRAEIIQYIHDDALRLKLGGESAAEETLRRKLISQ